MLMKQLTGGTVGGGSLKDIIKKKVFSSGLTTVSITPDSNYSTVNEGAIAIDSANRVCYLYCDFTLSANRGGSTTWSSICTASLDLSYMQKLGDAKINVLPLFTDEDSDDHTKCFQFSTYLNVPYVATGYGVSVLNGERYVVYTMWSY